MKPSNVSPVFFLWIIIDDTIGFLGATQRLDLDGTMEWDQDRPSKQATTSGMEGEKMKGHCG